MSESGEISKKSSPIVTRDDPPRRVLLLGHPVSHSWSAIIHNAAFRALELPLRYEAIDIAPDKLADAETLLRRGDVLGANVTLPHKRNIIACADRVSPLVSRLGACNTIRMLSETDRTGVPVLVAENTDVDGFLAPLSDRTTDFSSQTCGVYGAGGAARAICFALLERMSVSRVLLACRREEQADAVRAQLGWSPEQVVYVPWGRRNRLPGEAKLLVNTTPVGMEGFAGPELTPCPNPEDIGDLHTVYDLVYNPRKTLLLEDAGRSGARVVDGLEMLIAQASHSFLLWTGTEMPVSVVRAALSEHIS